jgi:hypothetical protein
MSSPKTAYQCSSQSSPPLLHWSQRRPWVRRYRTETPISCCFPRRIDYRGVPYRFEQGRGPVLVDREASSLLDRGALYWGLLLRVSSSLNCDAPASEAFWTWRRCGGTYGGAEGAGQRPGAGKIVHGVWRGRHTGGSTGGEVSRQLGEKLGAAAASPGCCGGL